MPVNLRDCFRALPHAHGPRSPRSVYCSLAAGLLLTGFVTLVVLKATEKAPIKVTSANVNSNANSSALDVETDHGLASSGLTALTGFAAKQNDTAHDDEDYVDENGESDGEVDPEKQKEDSNNLDSLIFDTEKSGEANSGEDSNEDADKDGDKDKESNEDAGSMDMDKTRAPSGLSRSERVAENDDANTTEPIAVPNEKEEPAKEVKVTEPPDEAPGREMSSTEAPAATTTTPAPATEISSTPVPISPPLPNLTSTSTVHPLLTQRASLFHGFTLPFKQHDFHPCGKFNFYVQPSEISLKHIIAPSLLDLGYCAGSCPYPLMSDSVNHTLHGYLLDQFKLHEHSPYLPSSSCVPVAYTDLSITFQEDDGTYSTKTLQSASVTHCGCR